MQILEGHSRWNSITFVSDKYSVTARRNSSGDISISENKTAFQQLQESKMTGLGSLLSRLSGVPFLRGVALFINTYIRNTVTRIWFLLWLLLTLFQWALPHSKLDGLFTSRMHYDLIIYGALIAIVVIGIRITPISRYHAAEHMTFHCVEAKRDLSITNIREANRVLPECGSNIAVFVFIILGFLIAFNIPLLWGLALSYSLGYEIYVISEENPLFVVLRPFYWLASTIQRLFLTAEPNDKEIEVAIRAMERLRQLDSTQ